MRCNGMLDGRQTGIPQSAGRQLDSGLFCGWTKIASVPATPFTWKGYVGRNFETELN
jgi:hypothetical protein